MTIIPVDSGESLIDTESVPLDPLKLKAFSTPAWSTAHRIECQVVRFATRCPHSAQILLTLFEQSLILNFTEDAHAAWQR